MSEALIFASTNPQFDDRLFIELQFQYMKIPTSNLGRTCCVQKWFLTFRPIFVHNMFSPCSAKTRASDKNLPVTCQFGKNMCGSSFKNWSFAKLAQIFFWGFLFERVEKKYETYNPDLEVLREQFLCEFLAWICVRSQNHRLSS